MLIWYTNLATTNAMLMKLTMILYLKLKTLKSLWSLLLMDQVQLSQGYRVTMRSKSPEIPGTHLIDFRRMKGWVDLGDTQWVWILGPMYLETSKLTTRPVLLKWKTFIKCYSHLSFGKKLRHNSKGVRGCKWKTC